MNLGETLGPYRVLEMLGAGGMGEVYRARDAKLNRDVAIKVLPEALAADPVALARFEREAQAVASLSHPNILAIHDFGREGDTAYTVMELLDGETLRARLAHGALPARKAIDLAVQIADGLAAAHEKGIVHRDLKPENVFVTAEGRAKVLDFGLAKAVAPGGATAGPGASMQVTSGRTDPGMVLGTAAYMSPEQVRGETVDHRSDLFSFGAVLYEMLAGRPAFGRETATESMTAILKEEPPEIAAGGAGVSPTLQRIVQRCLEKKPAERFQSARDLAFALESSSSGSGVSGPVVSVPARSWFRPRTWMWTLGAGAGAAGLTALLLYNPKPVPQTFTRLTFRLGTVVSARFSPDGQTVVYSAAWEGRPVEVFSVSSDGADPRSLGNPGALVRSVSSKGDIAVLDTQRTAPTGEPTLAVLPRDGGAPRALLEMVRDADWGPGGSDLAVIHRIQDRDVLEYPIGTRLYQSTKWLMTPRVSPDGTQVAVFESSGETSSLIVVDRKGGKRVFATGLPPAAPGLAWSPDGEEIWLSIVIGRDQIKTYAVNARGTIRLLSQDPSLTDLADVSRDGRALYTRNIWRILARVKAPGAQAERDFSWLDRTEVSDLSADGKTLVFGEGGDPNQGGHSILAFMVATSGGPPTNLGSGSAGCLSRDGAWVFGHTAGIPQKGILFPTGPGQPRILDIPGLPTVLGGCLLAGGKQAAVAGREPGQPPKNYLIDLDTGRRRLLPNGDWAPSADGTQLAFRDEDGNLAIQPVAGGAPRILGKLLKTESPLRWSLDGKAVYLVRDAGLGTGVTSMSVIIDRWDLATGTRTPWKRLNLGSSVSSLGFFTITIAPEADAYAYSYGVQQASDLFVVKGIR